MLCSFGVYGKHNIFTFAGRTKVVVGFLEFPLIIKDVTYSAACGSYEWKRNSLGLNMSREAR